MNSEERIAEIEARVEDVSKLLHDAINDGIVSLEKLRQVLDALKELREKFGKLHVLLEGVIK